MNQFWLGTAPFCDPDKNQCYRTPGYIPNGTDKCGDGACCWSKEKVKCEFSKPEFEKSGVYKRTVDSNHGKPIDFTPEYRWYGTAPFCGGASCDAYLDGKLPVAQDNCGDGKCCASGQKVLGMAPVTQAQRDEVEKNRESCMQIETAKANAVANGVDVAGKVIGLLGGAFL